MKYTSIHEFLILMINNLYNFFILNYSFSILLINIIVYIFLVFIVFVMVFNLNISFFKTILNFKGVSVNSFFLIGFILTLLSLAGMPPLLGFSSKFLLIILYFKSNQFFLFTIFFTLNIFMIYFYIQNIRFLQKKTLLNLIRVSNNFAFYDNRLLLLLTFFNFINFFGILYFEEFLIFSSLFGSFLMIG